MTGTTRFARPITAASRRSRVAVTLAAAGATAALGLAATGPASAAQSDSAAPSFQEFTASTYQDDDSQYIVNGDEVAGDRGDLRQFYDTLIGPKRTSSDGLIVNQFNGQDDKWSATQALNLTYCVSSKFGTQKANVVNAMNSGAGLWEGATTKINFTYVPSQDGSCTTRNKNVVFSVEPTTTTQYIARAFFPSTTRNRNILVNASSLMNSGSWLPGNILGHELGHVLGLRHEHTRPEAATCFEDNNWRPLTPYDSASIMHYPQCNGTSSNLSFTASDATGIRALYGS